MRIEARALRRRFGLHWVVHDLDHVFASGSRTAVSGPNGSGKSTLVRLLAGQLLPSAGELRWAVGGRAVGEADLYRHVSLAGPYVELIEELTGTEAVDLHHALRGFRQNLTPSDLWARVGWPKRVRRQPVATYSSGMRQRLRLLLALATEASAVFLDEPTSNLDAEGVAWYRALVDDWAGDRTLVIASNEERDFVGCDARVARWR